MKKKTTVRDENEEALLWANANEAVRKKIQKK